MTDIPVNPSLTDAGIAPIEGQKPKRKAKALPEKDRLLVQRAMELGSTLKAAQELGIPDTTAYRRMNREELRAYYQTLMDDIQLDDMSLLKRLAEGLEAEKVEQTKAGELINLGPDHSAREKYLKMAFTLRDSFPNPKMDIEHRHTGAIVLRAEDMVGPDPFAVVEADDVRELPAG